MTEKRVVDETKLVDGINKRLDDIEADIKKLFDAKPAKGEEAAKGFVDRVEKIERQLGMR